MTFQGKYKTISGQAAHLPSKSIELSAISNADLVQELVRNQSYSYFKPI
jgi:hypothetical protein